MIRILMVVHEMNRGGIENFIMNLYRAIDRSVIQFDFVAHTNKKCDFDDEIEKLGGNVYHSPDYRIVNHASYCRWWKDFLTFHPEYKIVHSHLDSSANIHLRISKKCGLITIAHSHSSSEGNGIRAVIKALLKRNFNSCCDYKFACSKKAAEWLFGKEAHNATIINNGIDSKKYIFDSIIREQVKNELNIPKDEFVLGHVGRIDKNKNQELIIRITKELNDKGFNTKFISVGRGIELEKNKKLASDLDIADKVVFLGIRDDVYRLMQAFDVFVMPSIYEGLPVSAIEAQASGLMCVLSDSISSETDITGNVEFFSLDKSVKEWAKKISEMIPYDRKDTYERIKKAGYDIMTTAKQLTDFYLEL